MRINSENRKNLKISNVNIFKKGQIKSSVFLQSAEQIGKFTKFLCREAAATKVRAIFRPEGEEMNIKTGIQITPGNCGRSGFKKHFKIPLDNKCIAEIFHKNIDGYHIYFMVDRYDVIALDDVDIGVLYKIKEEKKDYIAVETSHQNYQVLFKQPGYEYLDYEQRKEERKKLQDLYSADTGDILNLPCVRCPGTYNLKGLDQDKSFVPFFAKIKLSAGLT